MEKVIATCVWEYLSEHTKIEVIKYRDIYYKDCGGALPYMTLKKTNKPVPKGHEYGAYEINGEIYLTCWTNDLDCIARKPMKRSQYMKYKVLKKYTQLSMML